MHSRNILVYGGKGGLGQNIIKHFRSRMPSSTSSSNIPSSISNSVSSSSSSSSTASTSSSSDAIRLISVDLAVNEEATHNITVQPSQSFEEQSQSIQKGVSAILGGDKLDAILCVAGGWAGGNSKNADLAKVTELMWKQSVQTSIISSQIASHHLKQGGLLVLTGSASCLGGTPGMIGYGVAKAAVHQMTKSLAMKGSGMPDSSTVAAILPITLDTIMNRQGMPNADFSSWTPLDFVSSLLFDWTEGKNVPETGSLIKLETIAGKTNLIKLE